MSDQKRLLQFTVLESFSGSSPNELSLLKHDIVYVIENNPSGWSWVHEPDLGNGWFPTSYLEPRMNNENDLRKSSDTLQYVDVINKLDHEDEECPYVYATRDAIQKVKKEGNFLEYEAKAYRATHSYERKNQDELSFSENDIVLVVQETDTGWWRGSTSHCEGWFPASYVEELDSSPVDSDDNYVCVNNTTSNQSSFDDSLYQVTKLVDEKSLNSGENNRKDIHQVPQTNCNNRRRRNRSTGSVRRPSRDPPPIPICFDSIIDEVKTLDETEQPEVSKEQELPFPKATATVTSTSPKASHDLEPLSTWTCDKKSDNLANDETASNEDETNNVQGVVIFRRRNLSTSNNLSTLIKVTKRRSTINPNPVETPPNRPVPIPPPRNLQNSKENVSSRSRPTIKPRKRLQYAPKENPDRSPPMLPKDNLNESKDTLSTSLKSDNSDTPAPRQRQKQRRHRNFVKWISITS
ncbi:uncharacterized protein LOC124446006 [Xenia sp. Carnegie-2017]|uniref:uncharacterized protein LOC124446006 n=1 Tax=Xenia sp. Carnegie-2017 TaxID=2897299 RepID=UPI001F047246|nr:uncharacterized protein LOC124446006 [Xenia sp. Carnegie-2017]